MSGHKSHSQGSMSFVVSPLNKGHPCLFIFLGISDWVESVSGEVCESPWNRLLLVLIPCCTLAIPSYTPLFI